MARFVSRYRNYSHGVQDEVAEAFSQGTRIMVRSIEAKFSPDGITSEDIHQGLESLNLHGLPEDRDTGAEVSGARYLSLFDSERAKRVNRWTDEEHDLVVKTLRESTQNGLDYIEIVPLPAAVPWPNYDDLKKVEEIIAVIDATAIPVAKVIAYEQENQNRPKVIAALEELLDEDEVEEPVVINAGS